MEKNLVPSEIVSKSIWRLGRDMKIIIWQDVN